MQYCENCGAQLDDSATQCTNCGAPVRAAAPAAPAQAGRTTLQIVALVFMIIGTIGMGWMLIPLCWTIPMTVYYARATKEGRPVSVGFKVCALLFVSLVGGILALVDHN